MSGSAEYAELFRPQFHFTARRNWINDPNGLVFYEGEYHLFFQRHASGITWGPMSWGHAISRDLVHWEQIDDALQPDDRLGYIWSGSAVVDWQNTSGLGTGEDPALIACYTSIDPAPQSGKPGVQCIAYSRDRGRSWTKYPGNPVLPHVDGANRDPKILWHPSTRGWVMALYLDRSDYALFGSPDLRAWNRLDSVTIPGTAECPDFFELPVDGDPGQRSWVFWGATGGYLLGSFDGRHFAPQTDPLSAEMGPNGYAAQTWSDIPASDGRRIQISWMRNGRYPYMPFNQQMSFPVELTLRRFPEGVRLCRLPVREIETLWKDRETWDSRPLAAGQPFALKTKGDLFDMQLVVELGASVESLSLRIYGNELRYLPARATATYLGKEIAIDAPDRRLELRLLVDRASLELFSPRGRVSASFCFLPEAWDAPIELMAQGGAARIASLEIRELSSIWR
ncbi:MAG TPA: glycoside hydrolase family 32 protein [Spirochaetia bacterium]|nr:glycoside hydrolase family 32 protein [Spirochaetia bacterium]